MAGTDQYDFHDIKPQPRKNVNKVTDFIITKKSRWEESFGRELTPDEVTILVDCVWSGIEYYTHET